MLPYFIAETTKVPFAAILIKLSGDNSPGYVLPIGSNIDLQTGVDFRRPNEIRFSLTGESKAGAHCRMTLTVRAGDTRSDFSVLQQQEAGEVVVTAQDPKASSPVEVMAVASVEPDPTAFIAIAMTSDGDFIAMPSTRPWRLGFGGAEAHFEGTQVEYSCASSDQVPTCVAQRHGEEFRWNDSAAPARTLSELGSSYSTMVG